MRLLHRGKVSAIWSLLSRGRLEVVLDELPFVLERLSLTKRLNLALAAAEHTLSLPRRMALPVILQVEPINSCNLRCPVCACGSGLIKRPLQPLPFPLFQSVIDQTKDFVCAMFFWSWGEPFLHPRAAEMISYAKKQGLIVHSSTNGHCLTDAHQAAAVVESGLDSLVFAVEGLNEETYQAYRRGGRLSTVIRSIESVLCARERAGCGTPRVVLRFMPLKHNQHQNSEVQAFARDLGVDALTFRKAYLERGSIDCRSEFAPANSVLPGKPSESTSCFSCARPWTNLTVFSGGQVVICENDYNAEYSFGSADDASIRKLLFGRRRRTLLRQFAGNGLPFCRDCEFIDQQSATLNISTISFGGRSPDAPRNQADAA